MKTKLIAFLFAMTVSSSMAACPDLYPNSKEIVVQNTVELCNSFYVSKFNRGLFGVVMVSERLDPIKPIGSANRVNSFRTDNRIAPGPVLREYSNTGYDKGHMVPADDASSPAEMRETFLLTNMTPQNPTLNQQKWRLLEEKVRKLAIKSTVPVWVVTVAVYPKNMTYIGRIPVPSGYWKILYTGKGNTAWYAENSSTAVVTQYSNIDIKKLVYIN